MRTLGSRVGRLDMRTARVPEKVADRELLTVNHRVWRDEVLRRADLRCQAIDDGVRCIKAAPQHRMYAHHVHERSDGGSPFDPANGQCLCASHHTLVTNDNRDRRWK